MVMVVMVVMVMVVVMVVLGSVAIPHIIPINAVSFFQFPAWVPRQTRPCWSPPQRRCLLAGVTFSPSTERRGLPWAKLNCNSLAEDSGCWWFDLVTILYRRPYVCASHNYRTQCWWGIFLTSCFHFIHHLYSESAREIKREPWMGSELAVPHSSSNSRAVYLIRLVLTAGLRGFLITTASNVPLIKPPRTYSDVAVVIKSPKETRSPRHLYEEKQQCVPIRVEQRRLYRWSRS